MRHSCRNIIRYLTSPSMEGRSFLSSWGCVLFFSLLLSSCAIRPSDVLSNRKMEQVLVDLHRADGILQQAGYNYGHDAEVVQYYQVVLERNGITQAQFDSSLVWYTDHPAYFSRVYPHVLRDLQKIFDETELANKDYTAMRLKRQNDSIFLQKEPSVSDLVAHKTWEMHRYHWREFYEYKPKIVPLFTDSILEEMKRLKEEEERKKEEKKLH